MIVIVAVTNVLIFIIFNAFKSYFWLTFLKFAISRFWDKISDAGKFINHKINNNSI